MNTARPDHEDRKGVPRELRITERLLEKFGLTADGPGCMHKQAYADGNRPHSNECRKRIYEAMTQDDDELDRMVQVDARMGRTVPKAERVRRAKVDEADDLDKPKDTEEQKDADHGGAAGGSAAESPATPRGAISDEDDIAEMFMDSEDEEGHDGMPVPDESDEVRESLVTGRQIRNESDGDAEMSDEDQGRVAAPHKRARLGNLNPSSEALAMIDDLQAVMES